MGKPKQVVLMWFGEPAVFNVIDISYEIREVKCQKVGHGGSFWESFDKCLTQVDIDWHFICKASSEIKRLEIKKTILENKLKEL